MKITKNLLKQLIKEEIEALNEVTKEELYPEAVKQFEMLEKILNFDSALGRIHAGDYDGAEGGNASIVSVMKSFNDKKGSMKRYLMKLAPKGE
jgi:hypothetical protein